MTLRPIGQMRHRLQLQEAVTLPDGGGGNIVTWTDVAEIWAAIRPVSGGEVVEADALQGRISHVIDVRFRAGITPRHRFRLGARIFDIRAVIDADETHRFLRCQVEERLG